MLILYVFRQKSACIAVAEAASIVKIYAVPCYVECVHNLNFDCSVCCKIDVLFQLLNFVIIVAYYS